MRISNSRENWLKKINMVIKIRNYSIDERNLKEILDNVEMKSKT